MTEEYDFYRNREEYFEPKTPNAALKAYEGGFVPISVFTNKSISTKPLNEEPYDMDEIERLLSRENLGLQSNIMLMEIFEKLIFSNDQEIALFAAESINIIENRYNKRIQKLKKSLETDEDLQKISLLGRLFYELAILNKNREAIKKFFMKEAYSQYTKVREGRDLDDEELNNVVRILLELKLYHNALSVLDKEERDRNSFTLLLRAEVQFALKNYVEVKNICHELTAYVDELSEKEFVMISYWLGG